MTSLVACSEAARLDAATCAQAAIPSLVLMEDASLRLWDALEPIARERGAGFSSGLVVVCGSGNNGGDALALLRHAHFSGATKIAAILVRKPAVRTPDGPAADPAQLYLGSLKALDVPVLEWTSERQACEEILSGASLVVDGITGTGLSGPLREELVPLVEYLNSRAPIASIDLPSGLSDSLGDGFPLIRATWTLSIEPRKACLYFPAARSSCGTIIPIPGIFPEGIPTVAGAHLLDEDDLSSLAPATPESAYKGERGKTAIFAGSVGATGAAVLASRACLAAGAGIASLFAAPEIYPSVAAMLEAVMVKPEPHADAFEAVKWDALLIGPGWGRGSDRQDLLAALLDTGRPAVLDADALALFRKLSDAGFQAKAPIIMTPHPGEFALLTGIEIQSALSNPSRFLPDAAKKLNATIILKSHVTWIASPDGELAVWEGMESGLGTAGSGDVLAGLAAGLLARLAAASSVHRSEGLLAPTAAFRAACTAVIAHGLAGRAARSTKGWFESGALIEEAAKILGRLSGER